MEGGKLTLDTEYLPRVSATFFQIVTWSITYFTRLPYPVWMRHANWKSAYQYVTKQGRFLICDDGLGMLRFNFNLRTTLLSSELHANERWLHYRVMV